jgi:CBS domain containing-hemolysin-like protein
MFELSLYIIVFIALSGLMAMVDAAVLSVSAGEVEEMIAQNKWGAAPLKSIVGRITRAVVIIVLITNTINILGPILAGNKAIELYGNAVIGIVTAILTLGTILFSEIIPKSLGAHYAPAISRVSAPIILALIYALYPVVIVLEAISNLLKSGQRRIGTEAQIRSLVTIGRRAGYIESDEGQLIHRAFVLNDKTAADVMTPLKNMASVEADATIQQAVQRVMQHEYSRYPVFGNSLHDVKGMVMSRDILEALNDGKDAEAVSTIVRPALTVPAEMRSDELLVLFRDRHIHLAVVQDQGKTLGLVTLEDVLEELVGEIDDEKDAGPEPRGKDRGDVL